MAPKTSLPAAQPPEIPIHQLITALVDENTPLNPRFLYRLSDLEGDDLETVIEIWARVPLWRRQALMDDLQTLAEADTTLSFEAMGRLALNDPDPVVRFGGVNVIIASESESNDLIPIFLQLAEIDSDTSVRTASVTALAQFVYLSEMDQIPEKTRFDLENRLLNIAQTEPIVEIRRQALESLGFSSREEVNELILSALDTKDPAWIASALVATGRSADDSWDKIVLANLEHKNDFVRLEAVRAAGELSLVQARNQLIKSLDDTDEDVRLASIWSLSQIGGQGISELLAQQLNLAQDENETGFIEQALDNLAFNSDIEGGFGMFYVPKVEGITEEDLVLWDESDSENDFNEDIDDYDLDHDDDDDDDWQDQHDLEDLIDEDLYLDETQDPGD
jgi:hypothetical protein